MNPVVRALRGRTAAPTPGLELAQRDELITRAKRLEAHGEQLLQRAEDDPTKFRELRDALKCFAEAERIWRRLGMVPPDAPAAKKSKWDGLR